MSEKRDLYERFTRGHSLSGSQVPNVEHDGIRYLMDAYIPDGLVICSFKFASDSMKMRENAIDPELHRKYVAVARAAKAYADYHNNEDPDLETALEALNEPG